MKRILPLALSVVLLAPGLLRAAGPPETVHVTYHVQQGKLDEFLKVLKEHYPACLKDGLVLESPHLILTGKEDGGKPAVVEILTWRDEDAPDSVKEKHPDVAAIWNRLNALVEKRGGKPGIEIDPVEIVAGASGTAK
jgi:hypothetical protein